MIFYLFFFGLLSCQCVSAKQDLQNSPTDAEGFSSRRVGGSGSHVTTYQEYPYMVGMLYYNVPPGSDLRSCSGAIVQATLVLTAAHCVVTWNHAINRIEKNEPSKTSVFVGANSFHAHELKIDAIDIRVHPDSLDVSYEQYVADVALVTTASDMVGPGLPGKLIALSCTSSVPLNSPLRVLGYGMDGTPVKDHARPLKTGLMNTAVFQKCKDAIQITVPMKEQRYFCLISDDTQTLMGDSGGPVVYEGKLIGIIKAGTIPTESDYSTHPEGFVRYVIAENIVHKHNSDWIKSHLQSDTYVCG